MPFSFRNVQRFAAVADGGTSAIDARTCTPFFAFDQSVPLPSPPGAFCMPFNPGQLVMAWFNVKVWKLDCPLGSNTLDVTQTTGTNSPCNMLPPQVREALISPNAIQSNSGSGQFHFFIPSSTVSCNIDLAFNAGIYSDPTTDLTYYPFVNCTMSNGTNESSTNATFFTGPQTGVLDILGAQCPIYGDTNGGVPGNVTLSKLTGWYDE